MTQIQWQYLESMIGAMAADDKSRLVTMLTNPIPAEPKVDDDPWIGCMADESGFLDEVMEGVYRARETHPLRLPSDPSCRPVPDPSNPSLGLFSDEPELVDELMEHVYQSRENDPRRASE